MEDQGKRILLFVVMAGLIFFGWQYFFPPDKTPQKPPVTATGAQPALTSPVGKPKDGAAAPAEMPVTEQLISLESSEVRVTFSNVGGVVSDWELLYDPVKGRVMHDHMLKAELPGKGLGSVNFFNSTLVLPQTAEWKGEKVSDTKVRYRITVGALEVTKEYELFPSDYVMKMAVDVTMNQGGAPASQRLAVSVFGHAPSETQGRVKTPSGGQCYINGSISTEKPKALAVRPRERQGTIKYVGLAHRFDLVGMAPKDGRGESLACNIYRLEGVKDGVQVDLVYPETTLKPGDTSHRELTIYVGPRYLSKLEHADDIAGYDTGFKDVLNFGWFSILAKPMLSLLSWLYGLVGNWGVAIILLTILVKLATLYWTTKSMRSMRAMAALKPEIEALQKRYPDDKTKQQQAQMDLFKANGVSPLAGCLPMLLQMPIWFALYRMLSVAGELHSAVFIPGWLNDLTARDPFFILPVSLTALMFLQSRIQPATGDSMQQKMLQYGLPLMFGVMGLYFPSGLGVYMLTNSGLSILHSLYMRRTGNKLPVKKPVEKVVEVEAKAAKGGKPAAKTEKPVIDVEADDEDDEEIEESPTGPSKSASNGQGGQRRGKRRNKRR
jgi:YidC/Oxa1 family membrane protein insertase